MKANQTLWLALIAIVAGVLGGSMSNARLLSAQSTTTQIKTQALDVVDQSGRSRIRMATNPQSGAAAITLYDTTSSSARIVVGTLADGTTSVVLNDGSGQRRASFDIFSNGAVRVAMSNSDQTGGLVLGSSDKSILTFSDGNQKQRATFGLTSAGDPAIAIYDSNGKVTWKEPAH